MTLDDVNILQSLSTDQRLHFYEVLAHTLTVSVRGVWVRDDITDSHKLSQLKSLNEILHRVTAIISVIRLRSHEWSDADLFATIRAWLKDEPQLESSIEFALTHSFQCAKAHPRPLA